MRPWIQTGLEEQVMHTTALIILHLICAAALIWLFDTRYRSFRVSLMRHHLVGLNDKLYLAARTGRIAFDNPAYRMTRRTVSGMIAFAEDAGIWKFVALYLTRHWWSNPDEKKRFQAQWAEARSSLTSEEAHIIDTTMM